MPSNNKELTKLVKDYFGIKVADWGQQEKFDTSNATTTHEYKTRTVSSKGSFTVYNFTDTGNNRYKLAEWSDEFQEDDDLVAFMKDVELADVKDYQRIAPKQHVSSYSLYRLIPFTVNGKPQW